MARTLTYEEIKTEFEKLVGREYTPYDDYVNMKTKFTVRHNICGHEYLVQPTRFIRSGRRCPSCFGKNKPSQEEFDKRVEDAVGNEYVFIEDYQTAKIKIKVKHNTCGHVYGVAPDKFLNGGRRCPKCSKKYKRSHEEFVNEVDMLGLGDYEVLGVFEKTSKKIEFRHKTCGYVYQTSAYHFLAGNRCPKCSGNVIPTDEEFKKEVKDLVGDEYEFLEPYLKASIKLKIIHNECGNVYEVSPNRFKNGSRCPKCVYSRGEKEVSNTLEKMGIEYIPEWRIGDRLRADFYIPRYNAIIEYDGKQHFDPIEHWGGEENLEGIVFRDKVKNKYCDWMGIRILRIPYWQFDEINDKVTSFIEELKTPVILKEGELW